MDQQITGSHDSIAYIIPDTMMVHGNNVRMYAIFYSYDDGCYYSLTMVSQGRTAPKKDTPMYMHSALESNRKWYKYFYSPLAGANNSETPHSYIENFLEDKKARDSKKKTKKLKWVKWEPTVEEYSFMTAHLHRWQHEHDVTDHNEKCNAPAPKRNFTCEAKHGGNKYTCESDWHDRDGVTCNNELDDGCLPVCYYDITARHCKGLVGDSDTRLSAKYKYKQNSSQADSVSPEAIDAPVVHVTRHEPTPEVIDTAATTSDSQPDDELDAWLNEALM